MYGIFVALGLGFSLHALEVNNNECLFNMDVVSHVIGGMRIDLESYEQDFSDRDCIVEISIILVEMYEKIVSATVTYFLMMHNPMLQQNLHDEVAKIIARDMIKIFAILGKEFIFFIFNKKMTVQEKLARCCAIGAVIIVLKIGIDQFPLKKDVIKEIIIDDKSAYLSDKYNLYR